jgi:replicative DNA helicase
MNLETAITFDCRMESLIVGAALIAPDVAERLSESLSADDFGDPRNRELWRAIGATLAAGRCDPLTVAAAVHLPDFGLSQCLALTRECPSIELAFAAVDDLKMARERRELHAVGMHLAESAGDRTLEPADVAAEAVKSLTAATRIRSGAVTVADVLPEAVAYLQRLRDGDPTAAGLPTGFHALDRYLSLRPGELTIVGARPSVGKSALLLCIALNVARAGGPVLLVTCEMSARELTVRALACLSGVSAGDIQHGAVSATTWERIEDARRDLAALPLRISDKGRCRVSDVVREARAMQRREGLALVCVDYLGLLAPVRTPKTRTKENEIAELSGDLKAAAMALRVPLLVASQLNREAEAKDQMLPSLKHLRDSGAIEQDADNVLLLHRKRDGTEATVVLAKQRNGQAGLDIRLAFNSKLTRFADIGAANDEAV